jgi:glucose/arabinose dehydrogenase
MGIINKTCFLAIFVFSVVGCDLFRSYLVEIWPQNYEVEGDISEFDPEYTKKDEDREKIEINLSKIATGFKRPTDFHFVPNSPHLLVVLQQDGELACFNVAKNKKSVLLKIDVLTKSEQGLLGLAFHPKFLDNGKFYLNYIVKKEDDNVSEISEWIVEDSKNINTSKIRKNKIILQLKQPFANHNGGSIAFGLDGMLYAGFGDGGFANDPHDNGQNLKTLLATMIRIDIDKTEKDKNYSIPKDNPFASSKDALPEIWAWGLRNPWKFSFTDSGRLIVADVGQNKWEEIDIIEKGKNYGWNVMEGLHCFDPKKNCTRENFADPIYEYSRDEGTSITGGYLYNSNKISAAKGKYVFGDFVSGRIWAIDLPNDSEGKVKKVYALGKWPVLISSFGKDEMGELYISDYKTGSIFKIVKSSSR